MKVVYIMRGKFVTYMFIFLFKSGGIWGTDFKIDQNLQKIIYYSDNLLCLTAHVENCSTSHSSADGGSIPHHLR